MTEPKEALHKFILNEFLPGESPENLQDDTPLMTSGILDSISTLKLIGFIEKEYNIQIEAHEAGVENFDNIDSIARLIEQKR